MVEIADANTLQHLDVSGNARIHVGSNITIQQGDSKCLAHLRGTDPRLDKRRIEDLKGGLRVDLWNWVFADVTFKQWQNETDNGILWIRGGPGRGKTMMLCRIINELQRGQTGKVAYFFCQASNDALSSSAAVLRGLVYMLATEHKVVQDLVEEKYKAAGKQLFMDYNAWYALRDIFHEVLDQSDMRPMVIIIDALDECTEGLLQLLDTIISTSTTASHVKWVISSRHTPAIQGRFEGATQSSVLRIDLGLSSENDSFSTLLQTKVDALASSRSYDKETKLAVSLHFERNADENLLWISIACQALEALELGNVIKAVHQFPRGLDQLYSHLLDQITRPSDDETRHQDSSKCRQILTVAAVVTRPISIAELSCLISTEKHDTARYVKICNVFLTVREETIYFVHQSGKDFLLSSAASAAPLSIDIRGAHEQIFRRSLEVMQTELKREIYKTERPDRSIDEITRPQIDPLAPLTYTCLHWIDHLAFLAFEALMPPWTFSTTRALFTTLFESVSSLGWRRYPFSQHHHLESAYLQGS